MSKSIEELQGQLNEALSNIQADQIVFRVTLQTLFSRIVSAREEYAEEVLLDLRGSAMMILNKLEIHAINADSPINPKQLAIIRAQRFFDEIAVALSAIRQHRGESGRN